MMAMMVGTGSQIPQNLLFGLAEMILSLQSRGELFLHGSIFQHLTA